MPLCASGLAIINSVSARNVLGLGLEPCSHDPLTGWFRDGNCSADPNDPGSHTVCAVVTAEFLDHQVRIGNDLITPMPQHHFAGLVPGDRWCVTVRAWMLAYEAGVAAPVVLASTHQNALKIIPIEVLRELAVDVPDDLGSLGT